MKHHQPQNPITAIPTRPDSQVDLRAKMHILCKSQKPFFAPPPKIIVLFFGKRDTVVHHVVSKTCHVFVTGFTCTPLHVALKI